jgi:hypothetical protein
MSLKIGNVIKSHSEGKWVKVPAIAGAFSLKLRQMLPGESYAFSKARKAPDVDDDKRLSMTYEVIASHVMGCFGLIDAANAEIVYTPELFKNKVFLDSLLALTVEDGRYVMEWIVSNINKSDIFAEDDSPDFLAST